MSPELLNLVTVAAIVVGIFGTVIPHVPGLILSWAGVLVWALLSDGPAATRWGVFALATVLAFGGTIMKYVGPLRHLAKQGIPGWTIVAGGVLAIVGFFLVPVIGLFLGFVVGVFVAEWVRLQGNGAWASAWKAVKAVGLSVLLEVGSGLVILVAWGAAVLLS
jgi:uncharacterized protein YqgC (DUF456 family)